MDQTIAPNGLHNTHFNSHEKSRTDQSLDLPFFGSDPETIHHYSKWTLGSLF
jgi:hypothetical protein